MAGSVVAQGQRGTRQACANVAATEQQIESLAEAVDFLVDLIFSRRGSWERRFAEGRAVFARKLIERDDSGRCRQEIDKKRRHRKAKWRLRDKFLLDLKTEYTNIVSTVLQIMLCRPTGQKSPQKEHNRPMPILTESWKRRERTFSATASAA